jgi:hypothetical protein
MYATINLPGSSHFEYYGPASKAECESWLTTRVGELQETEQITSLLPQQILANKDAESWRYLDGSQVCRPQLKGNYYAKMRLRGRLRRSGRA